MSLVLDQENVGSALDRPKRHGALRRLVADNGAVFGLAIIVVFVGMAVLAPLIMPYDPFKPNYTLIRKPASALHWLGTDELGRDLLSRVILGARTSLTAGLVSAGIAV